MNVPGGGSITTYQGGLFLLCPRSLEAEFKRLRDGETPDDWDAAWIGAGQRQ